MADKKLQLILARVDEQIFNGDVDSVTLPGGEGEFTVLAHHEAFITPLTKGTIVIENNGETTRYKIEQGMCEVSDNTATVLI